MRIRYGWELALAALLVIEIVAFGAINPRMLDLNMLLFSTSDFICIGIVALPLTMVIVSGGIDISFGSTIGLCAIALGVLFQSGVPMPLAVLVFDGRLRCALERNLRRQKYARFMTPPPSVKPASSGKKREAA